MAPKNKKSIKVYLTEREHRELKRRAEMLGLSLNDYVRARLWLPTTQEKKIKQTRLKQGWLALFELQQAIKEIQATGAISEKTLQGLKAYWMILKKLWEEEIR